MSLHEFKIGEFHFQLKPVPVLDSIDLLPQVLRVLPSLEAAANRAASNPAAALAGARDVFANLRPLLEVFGKSCNVKKAPEALQFQPVKDVFDTLFARQHFVLLEWTLTCIKHEYGDFLSQAFQKAEPEASPAASA